MDKKLHFNYTHYRCLELANGKRTLDQLAEIISLECNIDKVLFLEDVNDLFKQLEREGLIVWNESLPLKVKGGCETYIESYGYPSPAIVYWETTNLCNLSCVHCYSSAGNSLKNELTTKEAFNLIDQIAEVKPYQFEVSGGEAILRKDIFEILEYAKKKLNVKIKLLTNGFAINEKDIIKLKDFVDFVHLSVDGIGDIHDEFRGKKGSFDKVINTTKLLNQFDMKFGFSTTVFKQNLSQLEDIAKLAIRSNATKIRYFYLYPFGRAVSTLSEYSLSKKEMEVAYKKIVDIREKYNDEIFVDTREGMYGELRKNTKSFYEDDESFIFCRAGTRLLYINSEGSVYPCVMCTEGDGMFAGNIRQQPLKSIWSNPDSFRMFRNLNINEIEKCKHCQRKIECGAGLRCIALYENKKINALDPFCVF